MTLENLIFSLEQYNEVTPNKKSQTDQIIDWIKQHDEFAFVKENLEGHITATMLIMNPEKTKVLLMFHKKYQLWTPFGGHCDGEVDVLSVAIREFHEESGIEIVPEIIGDIFSLQIWDVAERTSSSGMFQPAHKHYDILYLASIPEDAPFAMQITEVDDIRWFDIDGISEYVEQKQMLDMMKKIKNL